MRLQSFLLLSIAAAVCFSCRSREDSPNAPPKKGSPEAEQAVRKADELTREAYDLKLNGENGKALASLQKARELLFGAQGENSPTIASNLDDQASIYMRTGDFSKAKKLFSEAREILENNGKEENLRLLAGIERRLAIMEALERRGLTCAEPMEPSAQGDGPDAGTPPYFPKLEQAQAVFGKMNDRLNGCLKGPKKPVTLRMVITGRGQIILAEARGPYYGSEQGKCLADKLLAAAPELAADFPRFKACFRNFTYPFVVGE